MEVIYHLTQCLPKDELYGLTNQFRRAVISIPSNILKDIHVIQLEYILIIYVLRKVQNQKLKHYLRFVLELTT